MGVETFHFKGYIKDMKQKFDPKNHMILHILIYFERSSKTWCAHCLDFDLVEDGDCIDQAEKRLKSAIIAYIENAKRDNMAADEVYKSAPQFFWDLIVKAKPLKVRQNPKSFPMKYLTLKSSPINANETTSVK